MTRARNSANLASQGNLFVDIANDRTGIGSVVPTQNLHVAGTAGFHADTTFVGDLYNTTWDRSANTLQVKANAILKIGTGSYAVDISTDGTNVNINHNSISAFFLKTNDLQVKGSGTGGGGTYNETILRAKAGVVDLGFEPSGGTASFKLGTTAYGVNVTGTTDTDGLIVSGVATVTTMNVTGVLTYDDVTSVDSIGIVTAREGVHIPDNKRLDFGGTAGSGDFEIRHTSGNTFIENNTGAFYITQTPAASGSPLSIYGGNELRLKHYYSNGGELFALKSVRGYQTEIYWQGAERVRTTSYGIQVTGTTDTDGLVVSGVSTFSGNLTISNTSPSIQLTDTDHNSDFNISASGGNYVIRDTTHGQNRFLIASDGNVDIQRTLDVGAGLNVTGQITATSDFVVPDKLLHSGDSNTAIRFPAADTVTVETAGSERLRITSGGSVYANNIGVGTDNRWKIRANASYNELAFEYSTSTSLADNNIKFRLGSAGQFGIGNAVNYGSSGQVLTSGGASAAPSWTTITGTTINTNADNRIITGSGTANTLNGEANFTYNGTQVDIAGTTDGVLNLDTTDSRGAFIRFGQGGSYHNMVGCADGLVTGLDKQDLAVRATDNFAIATNGDNERLRIQSDGKILIAKGAASSTTSQIQIGDPTSGYTWDVGDTPQVLIAGVNNESPSSGTLNIAFRIADENNNNMFQVHNRGGGNTDVGQVYIPNELGIGVDNPSTALEVKGDITVYNANNQGDIFFGEHGDVADSKALIRMDQSSSTAGMLQFHTEGSGTLSEKLRITDTGFLSIYSNTGTIGNPSVPLHITTGSSQQQLFYFYKGSTLAHRVAHDSVTDGWGSGSRTFIGDTTADLYLGTANSNLSPTSSFIGINHSGTICMRAGSSPQNEEGITLRDHSLQYNQTSNLNSNGNNRTTDDKITLRAGLMNSTTVNDNVTAIKITPAAPRNSTALTKGGGIAWQHLDPHNWNGYTGAQFWLGMSLHSTPGQELSYLETWHNTQTSQGSQPNNIGLRIYPNGNVTAPSSAGFSARGVNSYSGFPGNGVWKTYYPANENFDKGDDFNISNGQFTAPCDGAYFFTVDGLIYSMGATNFGQARWLKNGSVYGQLMQFNGTDGNHRNFTFSIVMYMSTNETAEFQIWRTSGQSWSLYNSQFNMGGFLIG